MTGDAPTITVLQAVLGTVAAVVVVGLLFVAVLCVINYRWIMTGRRRRR